MKRSSNYTTPKPPIQKNIPNRNQKIRNFIIRTPLFICPPNWPPEQILARLRKGSKFFCVNLSRNFHLN